MPAGAVVLPDFVGRLFRDELHLIDSLPEGQVEQVLADVRRRTAPRVVTSDNAFAWIGAGRTKDGATDLSTNPKHLACFGLDSQ